MCWVGGPASFIALLVLSLRRLVMCASVGLRIEGRPVEESGGGLGVLAAVVVRVLPVDYLPPPGKGKEKIRPVSSC